MKLELAQPIQPFVITQSFGGNGDYYQSHGINIKGHNGLDLFAKHGEPVYAAHDGHAYYEIDDQGGHGVVVRTDQPYDYGNTQVYFKTIYWHLCNEKLEPQYTSPIKETNILGFGQPVKKGDLIGYADTTGLSTGDHLHFGLKPVIPGEQPGVWYNYEPDNGYLGAIDPSPYLGIKFQFDRNLYFGLTNDNDVKQLQLRLGVNPTGNFFLQTFFAVQKYQRDNAIIGTGFVGTLTRNRLNQ